MAKSKKENQCKGCKNLDAEKSNDNWNVCKFQPLSLEIMKKLMNSKPCPKREPADA